MKVLQVNNFHYPRGGSDRYFLDLSRLLIDVGVLVKTFSTSNELNTCEEWLAVPGVPPISTAGLSGVFHAARFFYSWSARRSMELALDSFRPDLVHLHIYYGQLTASILDPIVKRGIPIVQTLHEYKTVCATGGLYSNGRDCERCDGVNHWRAIGEKCNRGSTLRSALSCAEMYLSEALGSRRLIEQFVAVSEYQKGRLVKLGMSGERVQVVGNFAPLFSLREDIDSGHMLYVGRLAHGKGLECLIDAVAILGDLSPVLHVVGDGELREELLQRVLRLRIETKVLFKGFLSGLELQNEYKKACLLINPSELNETFGLTVLEALAVGCPVIAARSGALPELVAQGAGGLLFNPGDPAQLAQCIGRLVANATLRRELGKAGFGYAKDRFSKEKHLERVLGIYAGLV